MNYQASATSSIAPSAVLSAETDSISPLIEHDTGFKQGKPAAIPMYTPDPSKDPNEIVMISVPVISSESGGDETVPRRRSFLGRLKSNTTPKTKLKIVLMPRGDCEKFFARDTKGAYVGTEKQRDWTEQELEERYGRYKASLPAPPMKYQTPSRITGGYGLS